MNQTELIKLVLSIVSRELKENSAFHRKVLQAISEELKPDSQDSQGTKLLDLGDAFQEGENKFRARLMELEIGDLKRIVSQQRMDRRGYARKWKSKDKLVDLIVQTYTSRASKGFAFRDDNAQQASGGEPRS